MMVRAPPLLLPPPLLLILVLLLIPPPPPKQPGHRGIHCVSRFVVFVLMGGRCIYLGVADRSSSLSSTSSGLSSSCSASGSEDEGVSDDGLPSPQNQVADLSRAQLDSMFNPEQGNESKFAANGVDMKRIRKVVRGEKTCSCKAPCGKQFTVARLHGACKGFWRLTKQAQDAILWSLSRGSSATKRCWRLDGQDVCRKGFSRALGIGDNRLMRVTKTFRGKDLRGLTLCL